MAAYSIQYDYPAPLVVLAYAFNPNAQFHRRNMAKRSQAGAKFARPRLNKNTEINGWLATLINEFGRHNGFVEIQKRVKRGELDTLGLAALLRPFGECYRFLTDQTMQVYITPLIAVAVAHLEGLEGAALKRETKVISKNNCLIHLIDALRNARPFVGGAVKIEPGLHLGLLLKMIKGDLVDGVMYSLNDLKRIINQLNPWKKKDVVIDETWLTNPMLIKWLVEENVLEPLFKANLHQAQYVEKLEEVVRYMQEMRSLTQAHLTLIWDAQIGEGKHQSIINNVRDLLAKLARFFDTDQLDHLFLCFQRSWGGSVQQMRGLLEFIRRLAEDDSEGVVAPKVLDLLWNIAHNKDAPHEIMDVSFRPTTFSLKQVPLTPTSCSFCFRLLVGHT